jgi:hypothetical protein
MTVTVIHGISHAVPPFFLEVDTLENVYCNVIGYL